MINSKKLKHLGKRFSNPTAIMFKNGSIVQIQRPSLQAKRRCPKLLCSDCIMISLNIVGIVSNFRITTLHVTIAVSMSCSSAYLFCWIVVFPYDKVTQLLFSLWIIKTKPVIKCILLLFLTILFQNWIVHTLNGDVCQINGHQMSWTPCCHQSEFNLHNLV